MHIIRHCALGASHLFQTQVVYYTACCFLLDLSLCRVNMSFSLCCFNENRKKGQKVLLVPKSLDFFVFFYLHPEKKQQNSSYYHIHALVLPLQLLFLLFDLISKISPRLGSFLPAVSRILFSFLSGSTQASKIQTSVLNMAISANQQGHWKASYISRRVCRAFCLYLL